MSIAIMDSGRRYVGSPNEAFEELFAAWETEMPAFTLEAAELRDLWTAGEGTSDRAGSICASLGITVTQN